MTTQRPPHVERKVIPHQIDHGPVIIHPVTLRTEVAAVKAGAATAPAHPAIYQPWAPLAAQAEAAFKAELSAALRVYQERIGAAGKILDTAQGMATEQAGALQAAAWAIWTRYMESADRTASAIMTPALAGYDREVAAAQQAYDAALGDAEKTYRAVMSDVHRASTDAAGLGKTG